MKDIKDNQINNDEFKEDIIENQELTEIDILKKEKEELNDKYLRLAAEFENTRRRMEIDSINTTRNRLINVVKEFLIVMDTFDFALKHSEDEGIKSLKKTMMDAFLKIGVSEIESVGEKLNPIFHNAIQVIESDKDDIIIEELQKGYMFGDTVLRTASVIVGKNNLK